MKKNMRGLTLLELMIIVGIGGVMACLVLLGLVRACGGVDNKVQAEEAARKYLRELGYKEVAGVVCTEYDSDRDGYVSCTARAREGEGKMEALAVECATTVTFQNGCRLQKPGSSVQGR